MLKTVSTQESDGEGMGGYRAAGLVNPRASNQ
jgi:hypothetical protein